MENTSVKKDRKNPRSGFEIPARIAVNVFSFLTFFAFGFIALFSLFQTSVIDPENYTAEHILFEQKHILITLPLTILFFVAMMAFGRKYDWFKHLNIRLLKILLVVYVLVLGVIWVSRVQCIPGADSASVFYSASGAAQGDYTQFRSNDQMYFHTYYQDNAYYKFYPFQLGFVFLCEGIYRLFGAQTAMPLEYINVVCLALSYLGIVQITGELFKRRAMEFVSIILLALCVQPILFTPFPYGNIMGMCCAVWASYFLIRYLRGARWLVLIPSGVLLVIGILAKYNNMIYLVAFGVILVLHAIKEKKWQGIAFLLVLCICAVGSSKLIILSYENRAGEKYGPGVSQTQYLDVGLQDGGMAPGWYTSIGMRTFMESGFDPAVANERSREDISQRLEKMTSNPDYAIEFFSKKILSQWNEPTFESIWVSKVKGHYNGDPTGIVNDIYNGGAGKFVESYTSIYMSALYLLFAGGVLALMMKKRASLETVLLPLVLLGAFGYHLLFEAKSQYILTYIILLIPIASYAAVSLMESKWNLFTFLENKKAAKR